MALPQLIRATDSTDTRPGDAEIDLFGLTHQGKVRHENQDHFLFCTLHRQLVVHASSLGNLSELPLRSERLATLAMVADGVGGAAAGADASRLALASIARYVSHTMRAIQKVDPDDEAFGAELRTGVLEAHASVLEAAERAGQGRMATTLTLLISLWPQAYIVQVGDSRCYYWHDGTLQRITRDQTVAQDLVDAGVLAPAEARESPYSHVLSSALGADKATPVVTTMQVQRGCAALLCSDGLTLHVTDDELADALRRASSSEQVCRDLLQLALDRGGRDNITVLVGRAPRGKPA
jgi:serine/threonine protein phosphatase PrpC